MVAGFFKIQSVFWLGFLFLSACQNTQNCRDLIGIWSNREGQKLIFQKDNSALWLFQFGSRTDSFFITYKYDCKKQPAALDLSNFASGSLAGKTLFGILEWTNDSSFRFDAEPGNSPEIRPKSFNLEQVQTFIKSK